MNTEHLLLFNGIFDTKDNVSVCSYCQHTILSLIFISSLVGIFDLVLLFLQIDVPFPFKLMEEYGTV